MYGNVHYKKKPGPKKILIGICGKGSQMPCRTLYQNLDGDMMMAHGLIDWILVFFLDCKVDAVI